MSKIRVLALGIACLLFVTGPISAEQKDIQVGLLLCSTGDCADWGQAAMRGAQLAQDKINQAGGIRGRKIKLIAEDTKEAFGGAGAITAFRSLRDRDHIKYFIGPSWSPGALALLPIVSQEKDAILITPSANAKQFSLGGDNLFNIRPIYDPSTRVLAQYAIRRGFKRVAIFGSESKAEVVQSDVFQRELEKLGGTIVARVEALPEETDLRIEALKITAAKPQAVFIMNYSQMPIAAAQLTRLKYSGERLAIAVDGNRVQSAKGVLEGLIVADSPRPAAWFLKKFRERFGEEPGLSAENGYDALWALAEALRVTDVNKPDLVKRALAEIKFSGASGEIEFNKDRAVEMQPVLYQVVDGKLAKLAIK